MKEHSDKADLCSTQQEFENYLKTYDWDEEEDEPYLHRVCQCPSLAELDSSEDMSSACSCPSEPAPCGGILKRKQEKAVSPSCSGLFYFGPDDEEEEELYDFYTGDNSDFDDGVCCSENSTPRKGKSRRVLFADECGKDLVFVRVISAERLPIISPKGSSIRVRRKTSDMGHSSHSCQNSTPAVAAPRPRLTFEQPAADFAIFMRRLKENKVCLENIIVMEKAIFATIKVVNFCYTKEVFVRCSFDCWASYFDIPAMYIPCCDSETTINAYDMFSFEIPLSKVEGKSHSIQFAICMKAQGQEFWDNFDGQNYTILCDVWYDSTCSHDQSYSSDDDREISVNGNKLLSPSCRKHGANHPPRPVTRMRRNFCLY